MNTRDLTSQEFEDWIDLLSLALKHKEICDLMRITYVTYHKWRSNPQEHPWYWRYVFAEIANTINDADGYTVPKSRAPAFARKLEQLERTL